MARAGLPIPQLYASTSGALLHEAGGLAASVRQWFDSDLPAGPLTVDVAHETGTVLARLHAYLREHDDGTWLVAQPHYRQHTLNHIQQRFAMLARHLDTLSERTSFDTLNLERIMQRIGELRHVPSLLESTTPPQRALVHGDFLRPNLLAHHGRLRAVIDKRLKYDEPVRELGRIAFDVETIAAGGNWVDVAQAALTGYLAEGGIVPATAFYGCARLAFCTACAPPIRRRIFSALRSSKECCPHIDHDRNKIPNPATGPAATGGSHTRGSEQVASVSKKG